MSEQRQQTYFNLIQSLLNCRSNDEIREILAANRDLTDAGLVQKMLEMASNLLKQSELDQANRLMNLAGQQIGVYSKLSSTATEKEYLDFLEQVLKVTADSRGNAQVIYPLLARNTDKIDGMLVEILRRCWTNRLWEVEADEAKYQVAEVIFTFSNLIQQFSLGNKASNMEIAIAGYEVALIVYTCEAFPHDWAATQDNLGNAYCERILGERAENLELAITCFQKALKVRVFNVFSYEWATTQNNLANAYCERILGERAENLELAITYYKEALKVYTLDAFPYEWATTQNNLANAYRDRILGARTQNLEQAITCLQQALKIYTFDAFPQDWAMAQNNLANAYCERILGERTENLELAITYYKEALKVYTFNVFPQNWAATQNNLANAYRERILGERAQNLELAITCLQQALKIYTFDAFPQDWARIQNNLGLVCNDRILGKRAENLELAITCLQQALKVRTFDAFPVDWAATQNNFGLVYRSRILGERAENLELAITCLQQALKVRTFDAFPVDWAATQNNLANAYCDRILGERAENLELAITCLQQALKVRTFDAFPVDWAATQNNLANAYRYRILGERAENLELAITCLQQALKVRTFEAFPQNYIETLWNLGMTYQDKNQLTSAYATFKSAIDTVEYLRSEIVSGEESKRKQAEEWNKLYRYMVKVCLELDNITDAIEYVERSKTRSLVEQILNRDLKTIFPADVVTQLEKYRDEIATEQYQIQNGKAENPRILAQHLQQLRQQRNELQNRYLRVGYGFKFDSFQATLDKRTAIIEWYALNDKILAFIITQKGEIKVWQSQPEDRQALIDWVSQYLQNYYSQKDQWQNSLGEALKKLASILHIDEILAQIPNHCDQLILIPYTILHLFPLHALLVSQNFETSLCLLDLFAGGVSYAPSCQLLQQVQKRQRHDFQSLFAIQNPTEDLNYTDLEVQVIQSYFNTSTVLRKTAATLTAINNSSLNTYHCAHFSCHGYFNLTNASKSALILANAPVTAAPTKQDSEHYMNVRAGETHDLEKCLTLDKIFSLKLENCRLVTLSACETGLIDFENTSDEYIGLPSGFLLAGSKAVVSSLWKVEDLSTAFLMIKFIQNLKATMVDNGDFSVAVELQKAQLWLRNATTAELQAWANDLKLSSEQVQKNYETLDWFDADEKPFQNPVYWAAFCAIGQ